MNRDEGQIAEITDALALSLSDVINHFDKGLYSFVLPIGDGEFLAFGGRNGISFSSEKARVYPGLIRFSFKPEFVAPEWLPERVKNLKNLKKEGREFWIVPFTFIGMLSFAYMQGVRSALDVSKFVDQFGVNHSLAYVPNSTPSFKVLDIKRDKQGQTIVLETKDLLFVEPFRKFYYCQEPLYNKVSIREKLSQLISDVFYSIATKDFVVVKSGSEGIPLYTGRSGEKSSFRHAQIHLRIKKEVNGKFSRNSVDFNVIQLISSSRLELAANLAELSRARITVPANMLIKLMRGQFRIVVDVAVRQRSQQPTVEVYAKLLSTINYPREPLALVSMKPFDVENVASVL